MVFPQIGYLQGLSEADKARIFAAMPADDLPQTTKPEERKQK